MSDGFVTGQTFKNSSIPALALIILSWHFGEMGHISLHKTPGYLTNQRPAVPHSWVGSGFGLGQERDEPHTFISRWLSRGFIKPLLGSPAP